MELTATKEIIIQLKAVKKEYEYTIPRIQKMLESNGDYIALSTLRRVFADGSEDNDSFSYDRTLSPLARVLLFQDGDNDGEEEDAAIIDDRIEGLRSVILLKNEQIDRLNDQLEAYKTRLNDMRSEYDSRLRFLRDQIELKDRRMDEKDQIIKQLMDKCL